MRDQFPDGLYRTWEPSRPGEFECRVEQRMEPEMNKLEFQLAAHRELLIGLLGILRQARP